MNTDFLVVGGMITAFVAAILSLLEKLLSLRERLKSAKQRKRTPVADHSHAAPQVTDESMFLDVILPGARVLNISSYLLWDEIGVIVPAGILLNYLGLVLSLRLQSILYLDMIGTALAAFLLGPWWGAIVALLSNSLVNWLLYPDPGADLMIFPWSLVNMTGGLFWGFMARRGWFKKYIRSTRASALRHIWYLTSFGVLGACVMSVPGTFVQVALSKQAAFALTPDVADVLKRVVSESQEALRHQIKALLGIAWGGSLGWALQNWLQNCIKYIPDKTVSAAIALAVLKYGFPLFERELILGGSGMSRARDTLAAPLILGCLYLPSFVVLLRAEAYTSQVNWPLWSAPWLIIVAGVVLLRRWGPSNAVAERACAGRRARYLQALKSIEGESAQEFCRRLTFVTLITSVFFALCLIVLMVDFYRVAFNFFTVVYGFLLTVHLARVALSQNLAIARQDT